MILSAIPALLHMRENKETDTAKSESKNNSIDPNLQMFIAAMCNHCTDSSCEGALDILSRQKCSVYDTWSKLSPIEQSKKFLAQMTAQLELLEDLVE